MTRHRRTILLAVALLASAGCASQRPASASAETTTETRLRVENQGFLDRVIYLVSGSQRIRLGQVTGNSTATLRIPSQYVFGAAQLQFIADPIGSNVAPISEGITVTPGDVVTLIIPPS